MHTGMITREDELTVGRELWHVYGHMDRSASRVVISRKMQQSTNR